jgi:hypothetical protein
MTAQPRPCYRHRRSVWMVGCPECTEYHLTAAKARRNEEPASTRCLAA